MLQARAAGVEIERLDARLFSFPDLKRWTSSNCRHAQTSEQKRRSTDEPDSQSCDCWLGVFANNRHYSCRNANTFDEPSALINVLEGKLVHPVIGSLHFQQNSRIQDRVGAGST